MTNTVTASNAVKAIRNLIRYGSDRHILPEFDRRVNNRNLNMTEAGKIYDDLMTTPYAIYENEDRRTLPLFVRRIA